MDSRLMGLVAVDRLDPAVREALVSGAVSAVQQADRARAPALVAATAVAAPAVIEALTGSTSGSEALFAWKLRRCWDAERRLKSSGEPRAEMAALVADLCAER